MLMFNPQYFKVGDGWDTPDYATISLCWTAQAGIAPGDIVMLLKGTVGLRESIAGAHTHDTFIHSDNVEYKGVNHMALALVNGLYINTTSNVTVKHIRGDVSNGYDRPFTLSSQAKNVILECFYAAKSRIVTNYSVVRVDSASLTNTVKNGVIDASGGTGIDYRYDDKAVVKNLLIFNGNNYGVQGSNVCTVENTLSLNNANKDFYNATLINCASSDNTGTLSGYTTGECIDFANGNYQIKQSSPLHALGVGAFFEEAVASTEQSVTFAPTEQLSQVQVSSLSYENSINAIVTESLAQSQAVNTSSQSLIAAVTAEQKAHCSLQSIASVNNITAMTTQQQNHSVLSNIGSEQLIYAIQSEQLAQAVTVSVTSNDAQGVNVVVTEQISHANTISAQEAQQLETVITEQVSQAITSVMLQEQLTDTINTEQITNAVIVNIDEFSGVLVSVVKTEQLTQAISLNAGIESAISIVITEQLAQHLTQKISVDLSISAAAAEQLSHAQLIAIVQQNLAQEYDIDFDNIVLESITPQYYVESITPIYILEQTH